MAEYLGKRNKLNVDVTDARSLEEIGAQYGRLPGMWLVFSVILIPTVLIIGRSVLRGVLDWALYSLLDFVGNPVIALPLGFYSLSFSSQEVEG